MSKKVCLKSDDLVRQPGSVFVRVRNPNEVDPVPSIERFYSDWSNIAAEIADDVPVESPESTTVIDEVRVYAVHPLTNKRRHLYTGDRADDIQDRCRAYANRSKHRVELHDAQRCEVFHPITPMYELPISDQVKSDSADDTISIYNANTGELIESGTSMPDDFETRAQQYADEKNVTLRVETEDGLHTRFYIPLAEKKRMARENADNWAARASGGMV